MNCTDSTLFRQIEKEEQKWVDEALAEHEAEYEREAPEIEALLESELKRLEQECADFEDFNEGEDAI